jgi:hypothetical protein
MALKSRRRRLAERESDQARAKQNKTGNGHSEETVGSEFFTHGTPPTARDCWSPFWTSRAPPDRTTGPIVQSKGFRSMRPVSAGLMILGNTPWDGWMPVSYYSRPGGGGGPGL